MSFHLGPPSDSDPDDKPLPFPAPLSPDAFSPSHSFSPHAFLASLRNRHQTLEDLRIELRTRSKDLEYELVELVNRDYVDFVGLGSSVKGGEGRVEDLKLGLLGFRREVQGIVAGLEKTKHEVEWELRVKGGLRREKALVRNLLALARRLEELETLLMLDGDGGPPGVLEDGEGLTSNRRLRRLVTCWVYVETFLLAKVPKTHPFVVAQEGRMKKIKDTLVIDLRSALKEVLLQGHEAACLEVMGLFADIRAESEAVRVLKEAQKR